MEFGKMDVLYWQHWRVERESQKAWGCNYPPSQWFWSIIWSALKPILHLEKENDGLKFLSFSQASTNQDFKFSTCCFVNEHLTQDETQDICRAHCYNFLYSVPQPSQFHKKTFQSNENVDLRVIQWSATNCKALIVWM